MLISGSAALILLVSGDVEVQWYPVQYCCSSAAVLLREPGTIMIEVGDC